MGVLFSALFPAHIDPFRIHKEVRTVTDPDHLEPGGMLLLHGGEDIAPKIYGERANHYCSKHTVSRRDQQEMALIERAVKMDMPIVGICRGAQLLCAMDGGRLLQHITGHTGGNHNLIDVRTGNIIQSNSCHHQAMVPQKHNTILAVDRRWVTGYGEDNKELDFEAIPEIVYYPHLKAIAVQGHPEWSPHTEFQKYCTTLIKEFLIKE